MLLNFRERGNEKGRVIETWMREISLTGYLHEHGIKPATQAQTRNWTGELLVHGSMFKHWASPAGQRRAVFKHGIPCMLRSPLGFLTGIADFWMSALQAVGPFPVWSEALLGYWLLSWAFKEPGSLFWSLYKTILQSREGNPPVLQLGISELYSCPLNMVPGDPSSSWWSPGLNQLRGVI